MGQQCSYLPEKEGGRNEGGGEGGMHKLTGKGRNGERKTRSRGGRERETVKEANRIRMGECEWESLA